MPEKGLSNERKYSREYIEGLVKVYYEGNPHDSPRYLALMGFVAWQRSAEIDRTEQTELTQDMVKIEAMRLSELRRFSPEHDLEVDRVEAIQLLLSRWYEHEQDPAPAISALSFLRNLL